MKTIALGMATAMVAMASPALAAPVITAVGTDVSTIPFTFSYKGGDFTFGQGSGFASFFSISTAGGAAVRSVFGSPSTDFSDRNTVTYDENTLGGYASYASPTPVSFTNGDNFLGLRVTSGGQNYYGFAYTTDSVLNSYGFETIADTAITATTAIPAAVPEPATWLMMIGGFGLVGGTMRRRSKVRTTVSYA